MCRSNQNARLDSEIERLIDILEGTIKGWEIKNMYENGTSYEVICDVLDLNYNDYI